jgi:hypothetical protein
MTKDWSVFEVVELETPTRARAVLRLVTATFSWTGDYPGIAERLLKVRPDADLDDFAQYLHRTRVKRGKRAEVKRRRAKRARKARR